MKTIPLTRNYNPHEPPVGKIVLNESAAKLLAGHKYIIAPGFIVKEQNEKGEITKAKLIELSIIPWKNYDKEN